MLDPMSPDEIRVLTAYQLSDRYAADCLTPDSLTSEGAEFLAGVRDAVLEQWDYGVLAKNKEDVASEIANEAPDIHTYTKWQQFVDLGAWQEEAPDEWPSNLDQAASVALYMIAQRLASVLLDSLFAWQEAVEAEEEDGQEIREEAYYRSEAEAE